LRPEFLDIVAGELRLRARVLDERAPGAAAALRAGLPLVGQAIHDEWSGELFRIRTTQRLQPGQDDQPVAFQHPGLLLLDPQAAQLAVCYGQGRLQDGFGPLRAVPLAQIGGDLGPLARFGLELQFRGATEVRIAASADQAAPLAEPPAVGQGRIAVTLGGARATAQLLEHAASAAFAGLLPLAGRATNTHSSGPLVRFWNPAGGPEGETPLVVGPGEPSQVILYPGYLYYLPTPPWRGIRLAVRDATVMKGAVGGGGGTRLVPLARFEGDWSALRRAAEDLATAGATELRFESVVD
jgi:Protein of unknown function (DUF3830)